jgi:hypothetical protein
VPELLCEVAEHGEQNAARTLFDFSVVLARVIHWIVQNRPNCLSEMNDQSLLSELLAWRKAGEIARGSVLKLKQRTKLQLAKPATWKKRSRFVWNWSGHQIFSNFRPGPGK